MARDIKEITLEEARKLIGATVTAMSGSREVLTCPTGVVTYAKIDREGDIAFGFEGCHDDQGWCRQVGGSSSYWIRVLEEPPATKTKLEQLQEQRAEIDAKIKAEEERIARDGAPEDWKWHTVAGNVLLRYHGDRNDLPELGAAYIAWNLDKERGEVYLDGGGDAVVIHVDPLLAWLRKVGALDSKE